MVLFTPYYLEGNPSVFTPIQKGKMKMAREKGMGSLQLEKSGRYTARVCIGGKRCTARGNQPKDGGAYLDGRNGGERVSDDDTGCWLRMRREGNTITYAYKKDNGSWKTVYRFDVSPDVYGETVYVGLTSTSYIGVEYSRTPTYDWKFSNVSVPPPVSFFVSVYHFFPTQ